MRCGNLVAVHDARCWNCGRWQPALWGYYPALRRLGLDLGFVPLVVTVCGLLYLVSLILSFALGFDRAGPGGFLQVLAPDVQVLFLFGATGSVPVFEYGRWWTVLSSAWLHGGLVHIVFNMLWVHILAPTVARAYGPGRLIIIYTVAAVMGGTATTLVSQFLPALPGPLQGATLSIGASGAVFGLLGAIVHFGRSAGVSAAGQQAWTLAAILFVFGLLMPGVDNWGHLGGFVGGYAAGRFLDPRRPERGYHLLLGLFLLGLSAVTVAASLLHGLLIGVR